MPPMRWVKMEDLEAFLSPENRETRMSNFLIVQKLRQEHWNAFHTFLNDRRTTIKNAHNWLLRRGYRIAYSSVHRYRWALRSRSVLSADPVFTNLPAPQLRRQIAAAAVRLEAPELSALALFAAFLVTGSDAQSRRMGMPTIPLEGVQSSSPRRRDLRRVG